MSEKQAGCRRMQDTALSGSICRLREERRRQTGDAAVGGVGRPLVHPLTTASPSGWCVEAWHHQVAGLPRRGGGHAIKTTCLPARCDHNVAKFRTEGGAGWPVANQCSRPRHSHSASPGGTKH